MWESGAEEEIYREAVLACLERPGLAKRLEARPGVTADTVVDVMCAEENVSRVLRAFAPQHRAYRAASRRYRLAEERFEASSAQTRPNGRAGCAYVFAAVAAVAWLRGVPFRYGLAVPLLACAAALAFSLRHRVARKQLWRWVWTGLLGLVAGALWLPLCQKGHLWSLDMRLHGLAREVRAVVDELLGDDLDSLLLPESQQGLRSSGGRRYLVESDAARRLKRKLAQMDGGTIAVSGPRGAGKTTLLENCVEEGDFFVSAHAPATYTPHDFLTSLFIRVCEEYIWQAGYSAPQFVRLPHFNRAVRRFVPALKRLARWLGFAGLAGGLITLGLFATVRSLEATYAPRAREWFAGHADQVTGLARDVWQGDAAGAGLVLACAGMLVWALRRNTVMPPVLLRAGQSLYRGLIAALIYGPFVSLAFDPDVRRHLEALLANDLIFLLLLLSALVWPIGTRWSHPVLLGARRLYPYALLGMLLWLDVTRPVFTDSENPARMCLWITGLALDQLRRRPPHLFRPEPRLVAACRNHLYRLQTVQTSTAVMNTGASQLLTLGTSHSTSLSTVPPNYPALVQDFRTLLKHIARTMHNDERRVIIAVDEVDRLGTDVQALAFLGEIKAILGVPRVHYLISVAEDVGAAFVRRGLPHRDVTDSSLDEVVHVQPGVLAESAAILRKRAPGISDPYILLAHALSGGLPRDLIRYGRRLLEIQEATQHFELADISRAMVLEELGETLSGFRTLLAKQQWTPDTSVILGSFRTLAGHLRTGAYREPELRQALEYFAVHAVRERWLSDVRGEGPPGEAEPLIDEAATYAYFSLTLLDIFGSDGFGRRRTEAAGRAPDGDPELLAEARLELAVSPYSARPLIDGIRRAWSLSTHAE
ncbi:hypothetical protein [Streptomyces sp. NPDC003006]